MVFKPENTQRRMFELRNPLVPRAILAVLTQTAVAWALLAGPLSLTAASQAALVLDERLDGRKFGAHQALFEDTSRRYTIEQIARGDTGVKFIPSHSDAPNLGFSRSAAWLRFTVHNPSSQTREWLLELAYPHIDVLELYVPTGNGDFAERSSGDRRPFAERELPYRNVIFKLKQPPGAATYYLRAHTTGSLTLPLVAWSQNTFLEHQNAQQPALWMFYGLMAAIALYNLFIFLSVRQIAYFYYVTHTLTYALFQFVLNGLAFQYLWPNAVWWANQCMPACIAFSFFTGLQFHRYFLDIEHNLPTVDRFFTRPMAYTSLAATALTFFLPYAVSIRAVVALGTIIIAGALYTSARMIWRRHRAAYFYGAAWGFLLIGILAYLLKTVNMLPTNNVTEWTIQIGASLETILLSLGLADRINVMRRDLQQLNKQLGDNVQQLEHALERAEDARRAKSAFLASVSHELRTPLNSIINVPEGLRDEFPSVPAVRCKHCESVFQLESGEVAELSLPCPECQAASALESIEHHIYSGSPARTLRYLDQVVRSGTHLLEVVNDILDVSRLEAGQMTVHKQPIDMPQLFERVIAPMAGLAERQGVSLRMQDLPEKCMVRGDSTKLGQIFINLVGNAIKFSDGRGHVHISARNNAGDWIFSVRDEGIGICAADQARIFESFVQAEGGGTRRFGGSGLGLAITKNLVHLHDGEIWVESELGRGSSFFVRLPAYVVPANDITSESHQPPTASAGAAS